MPVIKRLFAIASLALLLTACATVPDTGRKQLLLISPSQEMQLGLQAFEKIKKETPISKDPEINAMVQRVGKRIAAVAPLPNAQWEFVVFDDPKVANAFCLPGGKVGIYTGILPITKDEAGLATVIGHEVAHAVARHGAERMSQGLLAQLGGQVINIATADKSPQARQLIQMAYGLGAQVGVMLPYSRAHELEADRLGQLYMARAGYDPKESIEFWKRFAAWAAKQGKRPPEFLSTHPLGKTRIRQLEKFLPEAEAEYRRAIQRQRHKP